MAHQKPHHHHFHCPENRQHSLKLLHFNNTSTAFSIWQLTLILFFSLYNFIWLYFYRKITSVPHGSRNIFVPLRNVFVNYPGGLTSHLFLFPQNKSSFCYYVSKHLTKFLKKYNLVLKICLMYQLFNLVSTTLVSFYLLSITRYSLRFEI